MTETEAMRAEIRAFEEKYNYNCGYMYQLLDASPAALKMFAAARPMTSYRDQLPADAHYVAAISVMQVEDCGPCLQLNLKLAAEAGVERALLQTLLEAPDALPEGLQDVRRHALAVARGESADPQCAERIKARYGAAAFAELALCIAGVRMYPALKRALLADTECAVPSLDF